MCALAAGVDGQPMGMPNWMTWSKAWALRAWMAAWRRGDG